METIIKTLDLTKKYNGVAVVNGVNMTINKGDIYGFIGSNGAGKTTFIRCLMGLIIPTSGKIEIMGKTSAHDLTNVRKKIGAIVETPALNINFTALNCMYSHGLLYGIKDKKKIQEILTLVGLNNTGSKKVKDFSLGMRQRMAIAQSLLTEPEVLLLDEPTNGMDPQGIVEMRLFLQSLQQQKGLTILVSSHILSELEKLATRIGIIEKGKMIAETAVEDMQKSNGNTIVIKPSDVFKAQQVLLSCLEHDQYSVQGDVISIFGEEFFKKAQKKLILEDIDFDMISVTKSSLEEYFIKNVGGQK